MATVTASRAAATFPAFKALGAGIVCAAGTVTVVVYYVNP